jgi:hypothetical protein
MLTSRLISKRNVLWALAAAIPCSFALASRAAPPDEPEKALVGAIEGDSISVQGPMTVQVSNGQVKTVLRSGGDIRVKSGRATIDLVEGGKIAICGPAHLSVLKSGNLLTVALDSGTIHTYVDQEPSLTVYTALLQAKPLAIGGAAQDTVVGIDAFGGLSVRAIAGAVRIEQQLTGQSIVVPQNSDVLLSDGNLSGPHPGAGHVSCELGEVKSKKTSEQVSVPATAEEVRQRQINDSKPKLPQANSTSDPGDGPTYKVYLAPMRYDANLKVQPPPDPNLIVLVRRVRVRPTLIFEGKVEGDAVVVDNRGAAPPIPPAANIAPASTAVPKPQPANPTVANKLRTFLKRIWDRNS